LVDVTLPWGLDLRVRPADSLGHVVERTGVFDLAVSETLVRLADPGEVAVDVGANVGYMTSLLALAVGGHGKVVAFEPQAEVRNDLEHNISRWRDQGFTTPIEVRDEALSNVSGVGYFSRPAPGGNRDGERLRESSEVDSQDVYEIAVDRLDAKDGLETVGVLKIDVEGHQASVLEGCEGLLRRGAIRDIVFEEHGAYPTPATEFLEHHGYALFLLDHTLFGPWIGGPEARRETVTDQSFLATLEPDRASSRLSTRGWRVLRGRRVTGARPHIGS
jgi:FkbM family methyltransferase